MKITFDNFDEYVNKYVYIPSKNTFATLCRAYTNGFFTSAGFVEDIETVDGDVDYITVVSEAVDCLPLDWPVLCCDFLDRDLNVINTGQIESVRFDVMLQLLNQDCPHTDVDCFRNNFGQSFYAVKIYF